MGPDAALAPLGEPEERVGSGGGGMKLAGLLIWRPDFVWVVVRTCESESEENSSSEGLSGEGASSGLSSSPRLRFVPRGPLPPREVRRIAPPPPRATRVLLAFPPLEPLPEVGVETDGEALLAGSSLIECSITDGDALLVEPRGLPPLLATGGGGGMDMLLFAAIESSTCFLAASRVGLSFFILAKSSVVEADSSPKDDLAKDADDEGGGIDIESPFIFEAVTGALVDALLCGCRGYASSCPSGISCSCPIAPAALAAGRAGSELAIPSIISR